MKVKKQARRSVYRLRTGNGLEWCQDAFVIFCSTLGIVYHCTDAQKSPQQKGTTKHICEVLCDRHRECYHGSFGLRHSAFFLDSRSSYKAIECKASFVRSVRSCADDSQWMREFMCPIWVRAQDEQCELRTWSCVFLEYASATHRLWCNEEKALRTRIGKDIALNKLASIFNEQMKGTIADTDHGCKKQKVELDDAKGSSLDVFEQQWIESMTGRGGRLVH